MARPLSEEKRQALLDAAAELVASLGTGASTAKIARAAGVSEGTLFTYFPTKDDLLNQLFVAIETDLTETMLAPYPADVSDRERLCMVWNRLIDWGLAHATARKALRQLKVSGRVTAESRNRCHAMQRDARTMVEACLAGHAAPDRIGFYIDTILFDLADISINAITARPEESATIRQAGFDLFWKGSAA
ncbi:TetR/AcrR family transcriptional regulator [Martelella mediterranea]|uniref:Fatty acid metabolism regulator protein n=1 Tax=Martelella mediterranea DSM 17316 TaxID=1122214 RepID=A0A1U9Z1N8_9HYPH|nr:TetR/AcrR family transcriptional regulator [Martelella mediterranea]AQZ51609.1 Fatty acid metabolism regulator protein [Martelella mediterranea DSM 17316]